MSSKKARRRERQEKQEEERSRRKVNPVTLFIVGIGAALAITVAVNVLFVDRPEPPYPGAIWSEAHGHWH